jgi:predicted RNase H-like nuclease
MSTQQTFQVAGVDGCRAGWLVAIVSVTRQSSQRDTPCVFKYKSFFVAHIFKEVLSKTSNCELVCVDIPIGLSDGVKPRECDLAARKVLRRPKASSVFPAPIRQCLSAKDYKKACEISFKHSCKKLSWQNFYILDNIHQVDDLMMPVLQERVREIHPEVSFWALNAKKPMQHKKRRLVGRKERMKLLAPIFSGLEQIVAETRKPKEVEPDDILDALVAAWTAGQTVIGKAGTLPQNPEFDSKGLRMEILCPVK